MQNQNRTIWSIQTASLGIAALLAVLFGVPVQRAILEHRTDPIFTSVMVTTGILVLMNVVVIIWFLPAIMEHSKGRKSRSVQRRLKMFTICTYATWILVLLVSIATENAPNFNLPDGGPDIAISAPLH